MTLFGSVGLFVVCRMHSAVICCSIEHCIYQDNNHEFDSGLTTNFPSASQSSETAINKHSYVQCNDATTRLALLCILIATAHTRVLGSTSSSAVAIDRMQHLRCWQSVDHKLYASLNTSSATNERQEIRIAKRDLNRKGTTCLIKD